MLALSVALCASVSCDGCGEPPKPPPSCTPGQLDCTCDQGGCADGLVCRDDKCATAPTRTGLHIEASGARACEALVLGDADGQVEVTFGSGVKGQALRQGERLAIAFTATADADLDGNAVQLSRKDGALLTGLSLQRVRCFDRDGKEISGAAITLMRRTAR